MEIVMTLDDKVRAYKVLLDKKDELAEQTKANNEELPEELAEVLSVYSELKVSKRKANTKALSRAKKAQEV